MHSAAIHVAAESCAGGSAPRSWCERCGHLSQVMGQTWSQPGCLEQIEILVVSCRAQAGDTESFAEFEGMMKKAPFHKGMEMGFTSTPDGGLAARVEGEEVWIWVRDLSLQLHPKVSAVAHGVRCLEALLSTSDGWGRLASACTVWGPGPDRNQLASTLWSLQAASLVVPVSMHADGWNRRCIVAVP